MRVVKSPIDFSRTKRKPTLLHNITPSEKSQFRPSSAADKVSFLRDTNDHMKSEIISTKSDTSSLRMLVEG